jgi:hypothetical protein
VVVHVAPVLLGDGVRLFERHGQPPIDLRAVSATKDGQLTALRFNTIRQHARKNTAPRREQ